MGAFKKNFLIFLILFGIPILGYLTNLYVTHSYDAQLKNLVVPAHMTEQEYSERNITYLGVCGAGGVLSDNPDFSELCSFADEIYLTKKIVLGTAALGLFLIVLIFFAKYVSGQDRKKLAYIFGPAVRIIMIVLAGSVVAQAGIFIYSIYTLESAAIQRVHVGILAIVGLAALGACFKLLTAGFGYFKNAPTWLRARELSKNDNQELITLIKDVANKLKAEQPDNVVVGLEPNFFVTSNDVQLAGKQEILKGRTLFLSTSLMRILTIEELKAIIGHELGHFRGEDTAYSMRFAPIYTKLNLGLNQMQAQQDAGAIATLPAQAVLGLCLDQFATVERTIGREREIIADKAGAEASTPYALASALVKVSLYSDRWNALTKHHIDILSQGNYFTNLPLTYRAICESTYEQLDWENAKSAFDEYVQPHPIDTHPPMQERLRALGLSVGNMDASVSKPADEPSISLLINASSMEEDLTMLEIHYLQAIGAVVVQDKK